MIIGDSYKNSQIQPLGFECMRRMNNLGFITKSIIVKDIQGNEKVGQNRKLVALPRACRRVLHLQTRICDDYAKGDIILGKTQSSLRSMSLRDIRLCGVSINLHFEALS